jgi:hypothetical protein
MYPHSFQGFPQWPHYPYNPHFGYEQAGLEDRYPQHRTGDLSDVTPLGVVLPPLGIAQALGGGGRSSGSSGSSPRHPSKGIPWSTIALIGILAGGAIAVYTIYRGTKASEPLLRKAGEGAARALASRYGAGSLSARETILPPAPKSKPKLLAASRATPWPPRPPVPRPKTAYTLRTLPEYEAYR